VRSEGKRREKEMGEGRWGGEKVIRDEGEEGGSGRRLEKVKESEEKEEEKR